MELFDEPLEECTSSNILAEKSPAHYQYKGKYIMTAVKSGLMIIDQHRAHVRILYERCLQQLKDRTFHSQKVLFPEVVQFPVSERSSSRRFFRRCRAWDLNWKIWAAAVTL